MKVSIPVPESDLIFLGMPKWTLNCPPVTEFLKKTEMRRRKVVLVITYGGFDEKRYAKDIAAKIYRKGGMVEGTILLRRKEVQSGEFKIFLREWMDNFLDF